MKLTTTDAADFASDVLPIAHAARDAIAVEYCTRIWRLLALGGRPT
jgi:hypothetical protein